MARQIIRQVWSAIQNLDPEEVRTLARQGVFLCLHAPDERCYEDMEEYFCPSWMSRERRLEGFQYLFRAGEAETPAKCDIHIFWKTMPHPHGAFAFDAVDPVRVVREIVSAHENLQLPLARLFPPFRAFVSELIIHKVSKENAFFSLATALPDVVPSIIELPWAVGQFASDTAFLTVNQVRMAFLLAAASDRPVGYSEQRSEIGSIMAGAFGWRAIARQLVGKIPLGGGLIPKAAIAYAGTFVAGNVLDRLYREGYDISREDRKSAYEAAYEKGKKVAADLLDSISRRR